MEPKQNTLGKWRNKTEREKHTIAVVGSTVLTTLVVLFWGYTFFNTLGSSKEMAKNEEYNKQFSPLAPFKNLFSDSAKKIGDGIETVKSSASVFFSEDITTGTDVVQ